MAPTDVAEIITKRSLSLRLIVSAFALIILAFLGSSAVAELSALGIDRAARDMVTKALPSIERLASARARLRNFEVVADELAEATTDEHRSTEQAALMRARLDLDQELLRYLEMPSSPEERLLFAGVQQKLSMLDGVLERLIDAVEHDELAAAAALSNQELRDVVAALHGDLAKLASFNASEANRSAIDVASIRARALRLTFALDAACVLFAGIMIFLVARAERRHRELVRTHQEVLQARTTELEMFAQRVAHDLLSPLMPVSLSLGQIKQHASNNPRVCEAISRAETGLQRSRDIVEALYQFARSGAQPKPGSLASVPQIVADVVETVGSSYPSVSMTTAGSEPVDAACDPGVLTSILSNLVENAAKFSRDSIAKMVGIRYRAAGSMVRVEVEDSGGGLEPGLEEKVFEPYVRGVRSAKGLGLGLATVKRLVMAHGGHAGVVSKRGAGCTFWVELPRPPARESAPEVSEASSAQEAALPTHADPRRSH